jgi:hypothetical protein
MRIRIMALSGALAASTLLSAPAMAGATSPTTDPEPAATTAPQQGQPTAKFRNSCRPSIAALPKLVEGKPSTQTLKPGSPKGLYIWHEKAGWRVRLTHDQKRVDKNGASKPQVIDVRGRITSTRAFAKVQTVRLERKQRGEWVSVQRPNRKVMEFRFVNGGYIDGINFTAGCSGQLGFTVWEIVKGADGKPMRTKLPIYVGSGPTLVGAETDPALAASPSDVSRVVIRRTPVN